MQGDYELLTFSHIVTGKNVEVFKPPQLHEHLESEPGRNVIVWDILSGFQWNQVDRAASVRNWLAAAAKQQQALTIGKWEIKVDRIWIEAIVCFV